MKNITKPIKLLCRAFTLCASLNAYTAQAETQQPYIIAENDPKILAACSQIQGIKLQTSNKHISSNFNSTRTLTIFQEIPKITAGKIPNLHSLKNLSENDEIIVNINSKGGDLSGTRYIGRALINTPAIVKTLAEGTLASAAIPIFTIGDLRIISNNTLVVTHKVSVNFFIDLKPVPLQNKLNGRANAFFFRKLEAEHTSTTQYIKSLVNYSKTGISEKCVRAFVDHGDFLKQVQIIDNVMNIAPMVDAKQHDVSIKPTTLVKLGLADAVISMEENAVSHINGKNHLRVDRFDSPLTTRKGFQLPANYIFKSP